MATLYDNDARVKGRYTLGTDTIGTVDAGVQNEDEASVFVFDMSEWIEDYGSGTLSMRILRRGDDAPYPVTLVTDEDEAAWVVSDVDTAVVGKSRAQLTYTVSGVKKKTEIFYFRIVKSLVSGEEVPDPYDDWIDTLEALAGTTTTNATAAAASATSAASSASSASSSASSASTSASTASTKASEAASSATTASTKASEASSSATSAASSASTATTKASEASASASSAASSASTATTKASEAASSASTANTKASDAEAYSAGTRGGTAVESTDPAYHNNSKYWAELSEQSANISGYMRFYIDGSTGCLMEEKTPQVSAVFTLQGGNLYLQY